MGRSRRACPDGVFLAPRFDAYGDASRSVMAILREVTPLVEPLALDEAFLDVSGARRLHGSAPEIAVALRRRINTETGLVASVGVASTKFVAKLASDLAKPDGMLVVEAGTEIDFIHPLEVRRLWGVGPKTGDRLGELGGGPDGDPPPPPPRAPRARSWACARSAPSPRSPRRRSCTRSATRTVATCTHWHGTGTSVRSN